MCSEFKAYHYESVTGLETDKAVAREQAVFDEHQGKAMEFIDHLGDLLVKPHAVGCSISPIYKQSFSG